MNTIQRISVAMATYNGEKYIEEQLLSICRQTRKPDEIVISDDGSRDGTLEIVDRVAKSEDAQGIEFVVITDNPRHGWGGNFEWAILHTTGDLIFLCDQDDVWMPEKVEIVSKVFRQFPTALCVIHNADLIGKTGEPIDGIFHQHIRYEDLQRVTEDIAFFTQNPYLEQCVSQPLANGMVTCISKELLKTALPFPKSNGFHDHWLQFCALAEDACYCIPHCLTHYRLHGNNVCGHHAYTGTLLDKIKKVKKRLASKQNEYYTNYFHGKAMMEYLEKKGKTDLQAYGTAQSVCKIGTAKKQAVESGSIFGAVKLINLYFTNMRYRRSGTSAFLHELLMVVFQNTQLRNQLPQEEFL